MDYAKLKKSNVFQIIQIFDTDAEKEKYADKFQQMFIGKEERFIPHIKNLAAEDMPKSHPGSWRYIKEERHSLERNSNLGIYFDRNPLL